MNATELLEALPVRAKRRTGRAAAMTGPCALGQQSCTTDAERERVRVAALAYVQDSRLPFTWTCPHGQVQVTVEPTADPAAVTP